MLDVVGATFSRDLTQIILMKAEADGGCRMPDLHERFLTLMMPGVPGFSRFRYN
jgi:hypothetical protein